jgi:ATP/maltotriose-dependent transcriptional regulator MalT
MQGDSSAALALARDTVAATAQLDHVVTACIALVYNASIFLWAGDTVTAAEQLNRLDELAAAHDLGPYAAAALGLRGDLLCREGDSAGGISLLRRGLRQLDDNQYQILRAPLGRALAEALAGCGLVDEAMAAIDEAMACIGDEEGFDTAELLGTAGLVRLRAGDGTAGRDLLARALDCARRQGALASEQRLLQAMQAVGIPAQNR